MGQENFLDHRERNKFHEKWTSSDLTATGQFCCSEQLPRGIFLI